MDLLHVARVFNRDRDVIGQRLQQEQILALELQRVRTVDQLSIHAEHAVAPAHRDAGDRARGHGGHLVHARGEALVVLGVGDVYGLVVTSHPSGDSLAHLQTDVAQFFGRFTHRNFEAQFVGFRVHHQQRPGVRMEKGTDLLHDRFKDAVLVERGGKCLADFMEDGELADFLL